MSACRHSPLEVPLPKGSNNPIGTLKKLYVLPMIAPSMGSITMVVLFKKPDRWLARDMPQIIRWAELMHSLLEFFHHVRVQTPAEFVCQEKCLGVIPPFPSSANQSAHYYPHFMSFFHNSIFLPCWMRQVLVNTCPHDAAKSAETPCAGQCPRGSRLENGSYNTRLIANVLRIMAVGMSSSNHTTYYRLLQHHAINY